ncbi:MAG: carboxypeptidase M32 [Anaerolineaceae bacterium]
MNEKLLDLKNLLAEIYDLTYAQAVLGWDQQTYMPEGGANDRGNQMGTLARLAHMRFTLPEMGRLLDELTPWAAGLDPDSDEARLVKNTRREFDKRTLVPASWVSEFAQVTTNSQVTWEKARDEADFSLFQPHLEKIIELRKQYSEFFKPYDHIYDPQLDDFEPGLKTAEVTAIFDQLRPRQVALIQQIQKAPQVDNSFMSKDFPEEAQWNFGVKVISDIGFDWNRGRQDHSAHPFTTTFGLGDVRITTRVMKNYLSAALFGTIHECGHALYEQGFNPAYERTPMAVANSMAIHESQSRMWENLVGRSKMFWSHYYPLLQKTFPQVFLSLSEADFYRGVNQVKPSFIRVEADEATYNLHIMLRMELEIAMLDGSLAVRDLPAAWSAKMKDYFGLTPPTDADGVLQDVHWSAGLFGYFPTYALGNLVSVQIWDKIHQEIPDLDQQIANGKFEGLLTWLRSRIHVEGGKYEPQELIQKVTGSRINPLPYLNYLETKYKEIYRL